MLSDFGFKLSREDDRILRLDPIMTRKRRAG
jgi:hypothetical protein